MRWLKELLGIVGNGRPGDFDLARKMGAEIETISGRTIARFSSGIVMGTVGDLDYLEKRGLLNAPRAALTEERDALIRDKEEAQSLLEWPFASVRELANETGRLRMNEHALTEERDRLRANAPLFAVHVIGPDDIWPMPDLETARQSAKKLNDWHFNRADKRPDDPSLYAVVTVYPHDADSHASGLANAAAEFGFTLTARPTP